MKLEELKVYELSMELGESVWLIVEKWNYFSKDTIGKQLMRSVDSVAANLSEGFGRFHLRILLIFPEGHFMKQKHGLEKLIIEI